jgi:6-phosphogluconolactonase
MDTSQVRIFQTSGELNHAALDRLMMIASMAVQSRQSARIVLSGGSTPLGLLQLLAQPENQQAIPWQHVHFFWADERCVPPDHPESNYGQARKALLDLVPVPEENLHPIHGEMEPAAAAAGYARTLAGFSEGGRPYPRMDLTLLGLGADGHTASLFPGQVNSQEGTSTAIAVTADYMGRPARRVTLTPQVFNASRNIIFLVSGESKAAALSGVINGPPDPLHLPAQRIRPTDGTLTWLVDSAAALKLKQD